MIDATAFNLRLLARADLLLLLSRWLGPEADADHLDRATAADDLAELAGHCDLAGAPGLAGALAALAAARRATPATTWQAEHSRLFEGGCLCPVNETAYVRRDKGAILADLAGFYGAFGFAPAEDVGEKPDHVICELQFTALLLVMLARAEDSGDGEAATITSEALLAFADDHLGAWLGLFCSRLSETAVLPAFVVLAEVLDGAWQALAEAHGFPTGAPTAVAGGPVDDPAATPYECDGC